MSRRRKETAAAGAPAPSPRPVPVPVPVPASPAVTPVAEASVAPGGTSRRTLWIAAALIFGLSVFLYLPSIHHDFVYDDTIIVRDNARLRDLGRPDLYLGTSYWNRPGLNREYRPLTLASYTLQFAATGPTPGPFHLVNVVLHGLVCLAGFWLAWLMFRRLWLATLATLLFAVHPIHVEAVVGVVGRAELQSSLGFLVALTLGLLAARRSGGTRWALGAASGLCAALAIGSKENAITLLPMLAATPFFAVGGGVFDAEGSVRRAGTFLKGAAEKIAAPVIFCGLALGAYLTARYLVLGSLSGHADSRVTSQEIYDNPLIALDGIPRVLSAIKLLSRYAVMSVWPFHPSPDFSYGAIPVVVRIFDPTWLIGAGMIPLAGWVAWMLRRRPASLYGILFFAVTFVITSNIFFPIGTILAERLLYLPSFGFCLLVADLVCWFAPRAMTPGRGMWPARAGLAIVFLWFAALPLQVTRYLPLWKSEATLFKYMAERMPGSARANGNYGLTLLNEGKPEAAEIYFRRSIKIMGKIAGTHAQLGLALLRTKQPEEARKEFEEALRYDPADPTAISGLARVLYLKDDLEGAMALYPIAIDVQKEDWKLKRDYGLLLELAGTKRKNERYLKESVELLNAFLARTKRSDDLDVHGALARAHYQLHQPKAAAAHARIVLGTKPGDKTMQDVLKATEGRD